MTRGVAVKFPVWLLELGGAALVVAGVAMWSLAAALVVAGVALLLVAHPVTLGGQR